MKNTKAVIIIGAIVLVSIFTFFILKGGPTGSVVVDIPDYSKGEIIIYKSQTCGCCVGYLAELQNKGFDVEQKSISPEELSELKERYNIPSEMHSCHTVIIKGYFVEGHIPIEALEKLISESPDIDGIALPGMPSGTPGMPGQKTKEWVIYSIKDGSIAGEFMRI